MQTVQCLETNLPESLLLGIPFVRSVLGIEFARWHMSVLKFKNFFIIKTLQTFYFNFFFFIFRFLFFSPFVLSYMGCFIGDLNQNLPSKWNIERLNRNSIA